MDHLNSKMTFLQNVYLVVELNVRRMCIVWGAVSVNVLGDLYAIYHDVTLIDANKIYEEGYEIYFHIFKTFITFQNAIQNSRFTICSFI